MDQSAQKHSSTSGFTIVELIVVISVIVVLAVISVIGYGSWRTTIQTGQIKSDLNAASTAMENSRTFNNVYPTSLPTTVVATTGSVLTIDPASTTTNYCIDGTITVAPTITYYIASETAKQGPLQGTCATRPGQTTLAAPTGLAVSSTTIIQISLSWSAVSGATGYVLRCASDMAYITNLVTTTSVSTSGTLTALNNSTTYYCSVRATATGLASTWSSNVISTTRVGWEMVDTNDAGSTTCGITLLGVGYCWGNNSTGQIGNNSTSPATVPTLISTSGVLANKTLLSISVGNTHTCAIASDNNAYCWGSDSNGELGNNTSASPTFLVPVAVDRSGVLSGKTVVSISTGNIYSCALASDSNVYCWGNNGNSQLGNNSTTQSLVPTGIYMSGALATKTIIALSSGNTHSCVIASDNNAYCWGYGLAGELGNNANVTSSVAVAVTKTGVLSGKTILKISSGNTHSCAIASDNNAYCWGYGVKGSLGNNVFGSSSVPVTVYTAGVLSGKTIASITTGLDSTCAIASDGNAYCWGDGNFGQLGNNTSATQSSVPVAVSRSGGLSLVAATSISASYKYACLTGAEYNIYCWGDDTNNQLTSALGTTYIPLVIAGPN